MNRRELLRAFIGGAATLLARPWDWLTTTGPLAIEQPIELGIFGSFEGILFDRTVFPTGITLKNRDTIIISCLLALDETGAIIEHQVADIVTTPEYDDMAYIGVG